MTTVGAAGSLLLRQGGTGSSGLLVLGALPPVGHVLTVRMTCVGIGKVTIRDATGGLILATDGCSAGVVYSSAWHRTTHDGRRITVTVDPSTRWAVDVWSGNPALTLAGPTQA